MTLVDVRTHHGKAQHLSSLSCPTLVYLHSTGTCHNGQIRIDRRNERRSHHGVGVMLSFTARIQQAAEEQARQERDPLLEKVTSITRGMDEISTHALLDLLGLSNTTGNARRISKPMQILGFVLPGGYRDTVTRGWARPVRQLRN